MFIISILAIVIGPASFKIVALSNPAYIILNVVAAIFFSILYPPFSPISGYSTIDVFERKGNKYCLVGNVMGRKFRLESVRGEKEIELIATRWRTRCLFKVVMPHAYRK